MMAKDLGRSDRPEKMRGEGQGKFQTEGACQSRETVSKEILLAPQVKNTGLNVVSMWTVDELAPGPFPKEMSS